MTVDDFLVVFKSLPNVRTGNGHSSGDWTGCAGAYGCTISKTLSEDSKLTVSGMAQTVWLSEDGQKAGQGVYWDLYYIGS